MGACPQAVRRAPRSSIARPGMPVTSSRSAWERAVIWWTATAAKRAKRAASVACAFAKAPRPTRWRQDAEQLLPVLKPDANHTGAFRVSLSHRAARPGLSGASPVLIIAPVCSCVTNSTSIRSARIAVAVGRVPTNRSASI